VDLTSSQNENTLVTVTNVSQRPQIAHVTIWTDWAYPVLTFDLFLTGYDVQSLSVFDLISQGRILRGNTESGRRSAVDNPQIEAGTCADLPASIPPAILADIKNALTNGRVSACGTKLVGQRQADGRVRGYMTIDVVRDCNPTLPADPKYYSDHILHDNVLTGDYQQVSAVNNFAQGNAMVHIRAIPDGAGHANPATTMARTFYSRYQSGGTADRRQPLPSTFAARWITGGVGDFNTTFKIWREIETGSTTGCDVLGKPGAYQYPYANVYEFVRFDEEENPTTFTPDVIITVPPPTSPRLPAASRVAARDVSQFPPNPGGDIAGWFYMNLDLAYGKPVNEPDPDVASQNWVVVSMGAEGRFSADFDAAALGNGCSPSMPITAEDGSDPAIAPAPNVNPQYPPH